MSDELIKELRSTIGDLRAELAKVKDETIDRRGKLKDAGRIKAELEAQIVALTAERDDFAEKLEFVYTANEKMVAERDEEAQALTAERDEWQAKAEASPGELAQANEALKGEILTRDRRDEWTTSIGDQLNDKVKMERVWEAAGYKPGQAPATPEEIKELVAKAREAEHYLFRKDGGETPTVAAGAAKVPTPKPPLTVNGDGGRGARVSTPGQVTYHRRELSVPGWETTRPELHAALADRTAVERPD